MSTRLVFLPSFLLLHIFFELSVHPNREVAFSFLYFPSTGRFEGQSIFICTNTCGTDNAFDCFFLDHPRQFVDVCVPSAEDHANVLELLRLQGGLRNKRREKS